MCAGALIQSRIRKLYIGTMDPKTGACGSVLNLLQDYPFNHKIEIETGILGQECEQLLKQFLKNYVKKRNKRSGIEAVITRLIRNQLGAF